MNKSNRGRPQVKVLEKIGYDLDTRRPKFTLTATDPVLAEAMSMDGGTATDEDNYTSVVDFGGA